MTSVTCRSIIRTESSVTPSSLTSRNGSDHRPCDVDAARRRYLISLGLSPEQNCLRLGWAEKQSVLKEPRATSSTHSETAVKVTSISAGSNGHVQRRVVSVLMVVQTVCCDDVADWRDVHGEQQWTEHTTLWYARRTDGWQRLLGTYGDVLPVLVPPCDI